MNIYPICKVNVGPKIDTSMAHFKVKRDKYAIGIANMKLQISYQKMNKTEFIQSIELKIYSKHFSNGKQ
jgi:hypothetical protein